MRTIKEFKEAFDETSNCKWPSAQVDLIGKVDLIFELLLSDEFAASIAKRLMDYNIYTGEIEKTNAE